MLPAIQQTSKHSENKSNSFAPLKMISVGMLGVLSSIGTIGYVEKFLAEGTIESLARSMIFGAIFLVVVNLEAVILKKGTLMFLFALLQGALPLVLFYDRFSKHRLPIILLVGAGLCVLYQFTGLIRGKGIAENSLRVKFFHIARVVVPKAITGLLILVSALMYSTYFEWKLFNDALGKKLSGALLDSSESVIKLWLLDVSMDQTVDEFIGAIAQAEIRKRKTGAAEKHEIELNLELLAPEQKEVVIKQIVDQARASVENITGPLNGSETVKDASYNMLKGQLESLNKNKNGKKNALFGVIVTLTIFGVFRSFAFLISWIIEFLAFLVFKFLVAVRFVNVTFENTSKETLGL